MSTDNNVVKSITKAFKILEQFDLQNHELSITELKNKLDIPMTTIHRILTSLESIGYIRQSSTNGRYSLGIKSLVLGSMVKETTELKNIARNHLRTLSDKYNETVHLVIESEGTAVCIEQITTNRRLSVTPNMGKARDLHCSSAGKCLFAFLPDDRREKYVEHMDLTQYTPYTITDKTLLMQEIEKIRQEGFSIDNQEVEIGLICVGSPIFDHRGKCIAAVSMSFPSSRFNNYDSVKEDVINTAKAISDELM